MNSKLFIFIFDVQHGSAAYLRTPNDKHIMIDLGVGSLASTDQTFSPLVHLWNHHGVRKLDLVILTHPHRDHLDDISNFEHFSPAVLIRPRHLTEDEIRAGNQGKEGPILDKYLEIDAHYRTPILDWNDPKLPENNGGVSIEHFVPYTCARSNLNNHSIITVLSYAGTKIVIPGDNEAPSWRELLDNPAFVRAIHGTNILVAAHHGREAGYCEDIFEHMPGLCLTVVSDGPASDTSATTKYSNHSKGWQVHSRSGKAPEIRRCLTTHQDKAVLVQLGFNPTGKSYREVSVA